MNLHVTYLIHYNFFPNGSKNLSLPPPQIFMVYKPLHILKIPINDPVDGFQFFIPYSILGMCTISNFIRLFLLLNEMRSMSTTSWLLEWVSMRHFKLGWVRDFGCVL